MLSHPSVDSSAKTKLNDRPSHPHLDVTTKPKLTDSPSNPELDKTITTKLNGLFEDAVTKMSIDYSNQEIQDIQTAVRTMLERVVARINERGRVVARVNERGIFKICRIQPCGSMTEQTAVWKCDTDTREIYIEFDFLAVMDGSTETTHDHDCRGCVKVSELPVDPEALRTCFNENEISIIEISEREKCDSLFWREINTCLVSSCNCFSLEFDKGYETECVSYKVTSATCALDNQSGCDKCAVEMPTGTLTVNDSVSVGRGPVRPKGQAHCSLVFLWTSKAMKLSVYDDVLHLKAQPIDKFSIHVDFLPALELFKPQPCGNGYEHDCFIVPKRCVVCDGLGWRRSSCMAEMAHIVKEMSGKHTKCYKVIKYFLSKVDKYHNINWYHVKTIALNHSRDCSDSSEGCAECVLKMLNELKQTYETRTLKSFHLGVHIFNKMRCDSWVANKRKNLFEQCTVWVCSLSLIIR